MVRTQPPLQETLEGESSWRVNSDGVMLWAMGQPAPRVSTGMFPVRFLICCLWNTCSASLLKTGRVLSPWPWNRRKVGAVRRKPHRTSSAEWDPCEHRRLEHTCVITGRHTCLPAANSERNQDWSFWNHSFMSGQAGPQLTFRHTSEVSCGFKDLKEFPFNTEADAFARSDLSGP